MQTAHRLIYDTQHCHEINRQNKFSKEHLSTSSPLLSSTFISFYLSYLNLSLNQCCTILCLHFLLHLFPIYCALNVYQMLSSLIYLFILALMFKGHRGQKSQLAVP